MSDFVIKEQIDTAVSVSVLPCLDFIPVDLPGNIHHDGKDNEQADAAHDEGVILELQDDEQVAVRILHI